MPVRTLFAALLLAGTTVGATAAPTPKEQLLVPPKDAAHYVVVSMAGKHGDQWGSRSARKPTCCWSTATCRPSSARCGGS